MPPDPHTLDYPASLKQYAEWFRYHYPQAAAEEDSSDKAAQQQAADGSKPRNGIKLRWEKYKKSFAAQQVHKFILFPQMVVDVSYFYSYKQCLTITESRLGLLRSMTPLPSMLTYASGSGRKAGEVD